MIVDDVITAIEGGRSPIVLTERTDHLGHLAAELERVVVLRGGMGAKQTREVFARMASIPPGDERVVPGASWAQIASKLGCTVASTRRAACQNGTTEPPL